MNGRTSGAPTIAALGRRRALLAVGAGLSLALHAGSLLAFLGWRGPDDPGTVAEASEAISVEVVASLVLEAAQQPENSAPSPAPEPTSTVSGAAPAQAASEPQPEASEAPTPPPPVLASTDDRTQAVAEEAPKQPEAQPISDDGLDEPEELASAGEVRNAKRREEEERVEREKQKKQERDGKEREKEARHDAAEGGVASRAVSGDGAGAAKASASTGALLAYAAHVRARLAGHKPPAGGRRGTAIVAFGISPTGAIVYADVARSSGNAALDRAAVDAVRGAAPFPPPPAGATPPQLMFSIPFKFE